jgi:two-component system, OmpR family, sensor kinase
LPNGIDRKWRPSLLFVLSGALAAVLALPLGGLLALRALIGTLGFRHSALLIGALVLVVTVILGMLLWRLLLNPITALAEQAAAVTNGQSKAMTPLHHYGTQELRDLGQSVLAMATTLQNREATIRSFADHVTHELKSPITAIKGAAEVLDDVALSDQDRRLLGTIMTAANRMELQLGALRQMAAAREPMHFGEVCLDDLLGHLRKHSAGLDIRCMGGGVALPLNATGLTAVLEQLLANAAAHGATWVDLTAAQTATGTSLVVQDNGIGISEGNRAQVFLPFFTTRRDTGGTGMGLSIVQALLRTHHAQIALLPAKTGAGFRIDFD